ncbi:MAG: hypothetical protein H6Q67_1348 [Firmicutes bacterium]|nr:hypothetical protein [Bacillota bacterium]
MEKFELAPLQSAFTDLTPEETTLIFYILGVAISQPLTIDEVNLLANGLFLTAQVLFTIASQRTLLNDILEAQQEKEKGKKDTEKAKEEKKQTENSESEIKKLQDQVKHLQKQIDALSSSHK